MKSIQHRIICLIALCFPGIANSQDSAFQQYQPTLDGIRNLESNRDPKCHASASRLEDFICGTPLSFTARARGYELQRDWFLSIWRKSTESARARDAESIDENDLELALQDCPEIDIEEDESFTLTINEETGVSVSRRDFEHYSSVAFVNRAILAAQQELLLLSGEKLYDLTPATRKKVTDRLNLYSIAALQQADQISRSDNSFKTTPETLTAAWRPFFPGGEIPKSHVMPASLPESTISPPLISSIVKEKLQAYQAYNKVSQAVFMRNLQVYFARKRLPPGAEAQEAFKNIFLENMVQFAIDCLHLAQNKTKERGAQVIRAEDMHEALQELTPYQLNQYEDVIFFPNLDKSRQVSIEAYDFDSFRDSGLHWQYAGFALEDPKLNLETEPDPHAAELLAEGIAQLGVLTLRTAGIAAENRGSEILSGDDLLSAFETISQRLATMPSRDKAGKPEIISSTPKPEGGGQNLFTEVSEERGVNFMHRSADWLNRLLRSYLKKGADVGTLTIPPAFGGSGVAAEDVNGDGWMDFLILSGSGNSLYLNEKGKGFTDATKTAGLEWDGPSPGEPRQPLIADLNNDGLQDIVITYVNESHRVYQNLGEGRFADVTQNANLGGRGEVAGPAVVFDFDNDGLLDIYIGYFGNYLEGILPTLSRRNRNGSANRLFRNTGDFVFEDVSAGSGTGNTGWTQALGHTDFDHDGRQDIIVGNDFGINAWLRNLGGGAFEDYAEKIATNKPSFTMNVGISDLNRDRFPDVYISNIVTLVKDDKYVLPNQDTPMHFSARSLGRMQVVEANDLFLSNASEGNLDDYTLSNQLFTRGFNSTGWSWDADFFDFDNDGDDDLYCVNGMNEYNVYSDMSYSSITMDREAEIMLPVSEKEINVFFANEGGKLRNITENSGLDLLGNSRSAAYLDMDEDGDLDIILNNYHEKAVLFENRLDKDQQNWLKIELIGDPASKSNRDAIGARIYLTTGENGYVWREIHGGIGYLSLHPKQQHFGLGSAEQADIDIVWPNGDKSSFKNLEANTRYQIHQGMDPIVTPPPGN